MITKKEYNMLKPYEENIVSACKTSTMRSLPIYVQDMFYDIYENNTKNKMHRNYSCPTCQLKIANLVGNLYFEYKKATEDKNG